MTNEGRSPSSSEHEKLEVGSPKLGLKQDELSKVAREDGVSAIYEAKSRLSESALIPPH
jgi:hypothetical protein